MIGLRRFQRTLFAKNNPEVSLPKKTRIPAYQANPPQEPGGLHALEADWGCWEGWINHPLLDITCIQCRIMKIKLYACFLCLIAVICKKTGILAHNIYIYTVVLAIYQTGKNGGRERCRRPTRHHLAIPDVFHTSQSSMRLTGFFDKCGFSCENNFLWLWKTKKADCSIPGDTLSSILSWWEKPQVY